MNKINYCGFITIIGRTNVGKSTLLNCLLQHKVSITSKKLNTTLQSIIGISTKNQYQTIYIDTPGINYLKKNIINEYIKNSVLIIFVVEATYWMPDDQIIIKKLYRSDCPVILAINKIDNILDKKKLLPYIKYLNKKMKFYSIIPISAKINFNINILSSISKKFLPKANHYFSEDHITDRSNKFMASEILREKLMRFLGDEIPYLTKIKIQDFVINKNGYYNIYGLILVKKNSHKKIIIGSHGNKINIIKQKAHKDMEIFFKKKVYLFLLIKTQSKLRRK